MLIKTLSKILLLCLTVNILLTACGSDATPGDNLHTGSPALSWQKDWLTSKDCRLPCWKGMTPGKTDVQQARNTVEKMSNFRSFSGSSADRFDWHWDSNDMWGSIRYGDSVVKFIGPYYRTNFTLGEVIQAYGQPEYAFTRQGDGKDIGGHPQPIVYSTTIIYLTHGFSVEVRNADKAALNDNTLVGYLGIFEPTEKGLEEITSQQIKDLTPWQGYKDFDYYNKARK